MLGRFLYEGNKPGRRGNGPLLLTPLQLLVRLAALVPPPSVHRHRHLDVRATAAFAAADARFRQNVVAEAGREWARG
jgi:hypothetical protein